MIIKTRPANEYRRKVVRMSLIRVLWIANHNQGIVVANLNKKCVMGRQTHHMYLDQMIKSDLTKTLSPTNLTNHNQGIVDANLSGQTHTLVVPESKEGLGFRTIVQQISAMHTCSVDMVGTGVCTD